MHPIPPKLKTELLASDEYKHCMRRLWFKDHYCQGRITFEHAWIYAGKQVQEKWAILSLCALSHSVDQFMNSGILDKEKNWCIALNRATEQELRRYSKAEDLIKKRDYLNKKYGKHTSYQ